MLQMLSRFSLSKKLVALLVIILLVIGGVFLVREYIPASSDCEQILSALPANLSGGFSTNIKVTYNDFSAEAAYSQSYFGQSSFKFFSPPALDGFELSVADGEATLSYRGLKSTMNAERFFSASGAGMFLGAVDSLISLEEPECRTKDDTVIITVPGSDSLSTFTAVIDKNSGAPVSLEFPQDGVMIELSDFTLNPTQEQPPAEQ